MSGDQPPEDETAGPALQAPDLQALARDWITLVQSELSALATDREAQESWQATLGLWAGAAAAMLRAVPPPGAPNAGSHNEHQQDAARAAAPARAAAAAAAPDARDAEIRRLAERVAELERRLGGVAADEGQRTRPEQRTTRRRNTGASGAAGGKRAG